MTIGAIFCRADSARGVGKMRIECLSAVTFGRNRLGLGINPFAVLILRADHDRARRTDHSHPVFLHAAVNAEHENVVPDDLRIIGCKIAVGNALKLV